MRYTDPNLTHNVFAPSALLRKVFRATSEQQFRFSFGSNTAAAAAKRPQAYSIVDPEEIPHMLDLHLFLGRKPTNVYTAPKGPGPDGATVDGVGAAGGDAEEKEGERGAIVGYDVSELKPDLVHYGNFPQKVWR